MPKLSAVITCFNNEDTILQCVQSLGSADEIIVLDSYSSDKTLEILRTCECTVHQQEFKGYSQQKQAAIDLATHNWVLLLDSDEFFESQEQQVIKLWKESTPSADAYQLPRQEWVFWQWSHSWVHKNYFLRLFDRRLALVSNEKVHESVQSSGKVIKLKAVIKHFGETSISKKIEKINHYSQLAAEQKYSQGNRVYPLKFVIYPLWYFFRQYIIRRQIFNGWAGFINAYLNSKYAFLKYVKLYELQKNKN